MSSHTGLGCLMKNIINFIMNYLSDKSTIGNITLNKGDLSLPVNILNILLFYFRRIIIAQIVNYCYFMPVLYTTFGNMGSNETCATGNNDVAQSELPPIYAPINSLKSSPISLSSMPRTIFAFIQSMIFPTSNLLP